MLVRPDRMVRMANFRLRTPEVIMLAFGRSEMKNSEEHSNSGSYLKRYPWTFTD